MLDDQERSDGTTEGGAIYGLAASPNAAAASATTGEGVAPEAVTLDTDDATLATKAFPGHRALCSETFMYTSRDNYPLPWLVREIAQNFVDGNIDNPGSLEGVSAEEVATNGSSTFTFTGNWPFKSFNDLVSFGSGKLDPEVKSAGGNGIGIKQSILGFMRDLGVKRFVIIGEGWEVHYCMKSRDEINARLSALSSPHQAKHGVFMANVRRSENRSTCKYIVETDNPQVQEALREFRNLGVCAENLHLQDMHFQNEHGAIKWLPIEEVEDRPRHDDPPDAPKRTKLVAQKGRLFINGQIFRYSRWNGEQADAKDYWRGPGGITVQLKDIQYEMSIDRPPMEQWVLRGHIERFVYTMSKDELIASLQASEYLWTKLQYERNHYDTPFCFTVIEAIVGRLELQDFSSDEYGELFAGKQYLHADTKLTETQIEDLKKEGYTICPGFFGKLHMPKASVKLSSLQVAAGKKPDIERALEACFKASSDAGFEVPYRELDEKSTPQAVARHIRDRLGKLVKSIIVQEDRKSVRVVLNKTIDKFRLIDLQDPPKKKDIVGNLIYETRGLAHIGLVKGFLRDIFMAQGQYVSTFTTNGDELYVRNNESPSDDTFLEFILRDEDFAGFCSGLTAGRSSRSEQTAQSIQRSAILSRLNRFWEHVRTPTLVVSQVALAALATLSLVVASPGLRTGLAKIFYGEISLYDIADRHRSADTGGGSEIFGWNEDTPDENANHDVKDKGIIITPTANQRAQLELLKEYLYLTTGYKIKGKLHVYRGKTGNLGYNMAGNIGIHEVILQGGFEQAVSVLGHEVTHNAATGHRERFIHFSETLAAERENALGEVAKIPEHKRDTRARKILAAEARWDRLRTAD